MAEFDRFALTQKLDFLNTAAASSMTWWVSSVVFCGAILAGVWLNRHKLEHRTHRLILFVVVFCFFVSIIAYGILMMIYTCKLGPEISQLATPAGLPSDFFRRELRTFHFAMIWGTLSFVLIAIVWCIMGWVMLRNDPKPDLRPPPEPTGTSAEGAAV
jgi:hypothetical protein